MKFPIITVRKCEENSRKEYLLYRFEIEEQTIAICMYSEHGDYWYMPEPIN